MVWTDKIAARIADGEQARVEESAYTLARLCRLSRSRMHAEAAKDEVLELLTEADKRRLFERMSAPSSLSLPSIIADNATAQRALTAAQEGLERVRVWVDELTERVHHRLEPDIGDFIDMYRRHRVAVALFALISGAAAISTGLDAVAPGWSLPADNPLGLAGTVAEFTERLSRQAAAPVAPPVPSPTPPEPVPPQATAPAAPALPPGATLSPEGIVIPAGWYRPCHTAQPMPLPAPHTRPTPMSCGYMAEKGWVPLNIFFFNGVKEQHNPPTITLKEYRKHRPPRRFDPEYRFDKVACPRVNTPEEAHAKKCWIKVLDWYDPEF